MCSCAEMSSIVLGRLSRRKPRVSNPGTHSLLLDPRLQRRLDGVFLGAVPVPLRLEKHSAPTSTRRSKNVTCHAPSPRVALSLAS